MDKNVDHEGRKISTPLSFLFSKEEAEELSLDDTQQIRPLTEGLGFHHDKGQNGLNIETYNLQKNSFSHQVEKKKPIIKESFIDNLPKNEIIRDELRSFYEIKKSEIESIPKKRELIKAKFLSKFFSTMIDFVLIILLNSLMMLFFSFQIYGKSLFSQFDFFVHHHALFLIPVLFLVNFFYFSFFYSSSQMTLGMGLMGIKIVDQEGKKIQFLTAVIRNFLIVLSSLLFFIPIVLSYHDKLLKTKVIEGKKFL